MESWTPIIKELIWPIFIGVLILWNRKWFKGLLDTITERVKEGSGFNIGPSGVSVGQAPTLPDAVNEEDVIDDGYEPETKAVLLESKGSILENKFSLSHRTSLWKMKNGRAYYRIYITTHAENNEAKSSIEKVVYHLHSTFKNPRRVISTSENDFLLKTNGWGEFVINAEIYVKNKDNPIKLNRYIELTA